MRVVGIAIITALLSAGCAIQAGDPTPEETQRPNELVAIPGDPQLGVNARPEVAAHTAIGQNGPSAASPNPSPWTGGGDPPTGNTNPSGQTNGGNGSGTPGNPDNPNPSPWTNPNGARLGGVGGSGSNGGNGG